MRMASGISDGMYKIYGDKHSLTINGSLYNIENAQRASPIHFSTGY